MRYCTEIFAGRPADSPRVVAMGGFDGLHIGHQRLIRAAGRRAADLDGELVVVTFWPPPQVVIASESHPGLLQTGRQKRRQLRRLGVDTLVTFPFERDLSRISPRRFAVDYLVGVIEAEWMYVGFNFTFGAGGQGNVQTLRSLGAEMGFAVEVLPPVQSGGEPVSSTRIRRSLQAGDVGAAEELLGRPYQVEGEVVRGWGRGSSEIGYPTANIATDHRLLLPGAGVYAGTVLRDDSCYPAVINVGGSPTFRALDAAPIEVHLIDFSGELYGEVLRLDFCRRLRNLRKFDRPEELARQIEADIREAASHRPSEAADDG